MKYWFLLMLAALAGCASSYDQTLLDKANNDYQALLEQPNLQQYAAKNAIRAEESLARAERFSDYLGSAEDVNHYAYLSQRYSQIAQLEIELEGLRQMRLEHESEQSRLEQMLREIELVKAQEKGVWLEERVLNLVAAETDRGLVMTLEGVLFDVGSKELSKGSHQAILHLARFLQINPNRIVRIEGYSDSLGRALDNQKLSLARAQSVAQALIDLGVAPRRIQVKGYGEAYPVAENASARGRAQNRRVEVVFSDDKGQLGAERP